MVAITQTHLAGTLAAGTCRGDGTARPFPKRLVALVPGPHGLIPDPIK